MSFYEALGRRDLGGVRAALLRGEPYSDIRAEAAEDPSIDFGHEIGAETAEVTRVLTEIDDAELWALVMPYLIIDQFDLDEALNIAVELDRPASVRALVARGARASADLCAWAAGTRRTAAAVALYEITPYA